MHLDYLKLLDENYQTDTKTQDNPKCASYSVDCLGALDRTNINTHIPYKNCISYQNCKGKLSQKILQMVKFGLQYCYFLTILVESVHVGRVLTAAVANHRFPVLEKKDYFADERYCNSDYAIISY